jgi:MerR family transcriptional regulator, copper efflux regulator
MVAIYFSTLYICNMLINELSKKTGVTAHTIRYYEKYGLIHGTQKAEIKSNKYFHYDDETVYKLELIRDAKTVGFTLNEIKQLIDAWYNKNFTIAQKTAILDEKMHSIDEKIKQLKEVKKLIGTFKNEVEEFDC